MRIRELCAVSILLLSWAASANAQLLGTGFTYQGYLEDGGQPKNGAIDLAINAFDAASNGALIGVTRLESVPVREGVFTANLDFGTGTFLGTPVFLEIHVREDADGDIASNDHFVMLSPRQELTPTPYALHAESVSLDAVTSAQIADGSISGIDIADNAIGSSAIANGSISAVDLANAAVTTAKLDNNAVTSAKIAANSISGDKVLDGSLSADDINTTSTSIGVQRRLKQACPVGELMRDIADDGTPVCEPPLIDAHVQPTVYGACNPLGTAAITNINDDGSVGCTYLETLTAVPVAEIDASGAVGPHLSVLYTSASGAANLTVAYYRTDTHSLRLATCNGSSAATLCDIGSNVVIDDPSNNVGQFVSLRRINSRLTMAYYDASAGDIKLAICHSGDSDCGSGPEFIRVIDSAGDVGRFAQLLEVRSASGQPRAAMVYLDASNNRYKYALCDDASCSSTTRRTLDGLSASGVSMSAIAVDRRSPSAQAASTPRFLLIAEAGQVHLVTCGDGACANFTSIRVMSDVSNAMPPLAMIERRDAEGSSDGYWLHLNRSPNNHSGTFCLDLDCQPGRGFISAGNQPTAASWHMMPSGLPMYAKALSGGSMRHRALLTTNPFSAVENLFGTPLLGALETVPVFTSLQSETVARAALVYQEAAAGTLKVQACLRDDCSDL